MAVDSAADHARVLPPSARTPGENDLTSKDCAVALCLGLLVSLPWALAVMRLPLTGEDFVILGRLKLGLAGTPHVFRPLAELVLSAIHGARGVASAYPYHLASVALHGLNVALLYSVAIRLLRSRWMAALCALCFGFSAACTDGLAWVAALNRPLSSALAWGVFALLVVPGSPSRRAARLVLVLALLALQFLANEEAYGTVFFVLVFLVVERRALAKPWSLVLAGGVLLFASIHSTILLKRPETGSVLASGASFEILVLNPIERARIVLAGWLPAENIGLVLLACALAWLLFAGGRRGRIAVGIFIAALIPFALENASPYRVYPSVAPASLVLFAALDSVTRRIRGIRRSLAADRLVLFFALLLAACAIGWSARAGSSRLVRWRHALREVEICASHAASLRAEGAPCPTLVNLESSSSGPFFYHWSLTDPTQLTFRGFLDSASGFEGTPDLGSAAAFGRRFDGSYGAITASYFDGRASLPALRLYYDWAPASSLEEARERLASDDLDLLHSALVEAPLPSPPSPVDASGSVRILRPFAHEGQRADMRVRVESQTPVLLAYQADWLFDHSYRLSPDQMLFLGLDGRRRVGLWASVRATKQRYEAVPVNTFGLGLYLPAGAHELELEWAPLAGVEYR